MKILDRFRSLFIHNKKNKELINEENKELINKDVLNKIINDSEVCKHAIKELEIAGFNKPENKMDYLMYQQVLEAIAVFASHGNSGFSAPIEIDLVKKLCNFEVISPLQFTDDEWKLVDEENRLYQNNRKCTVFMEKDGTITNNDAFIKRPVKKYDLKSNKLTKIENPVTWYGGLFTCKNGVLTGKYFNKCIVRHYFGTKGWMPVEKRIVDCVEVEINENCYIHIIEENDTDLILLICDYHVDYKYCPSLKDVRFEDLTTDLINKAYKEINNNK